jgi:hypothetical protein
MGRLTWWSWAAASPASRPCLRSPGRVRRSSIWKRGGSPTRHRAATAACAITASPRIITRWRRGSDVSARTCCTGPLTQFDKVEAIVAEEGIDCRFRRVGKLKLAAKPQHYDRLARRSSSRARWIPTRAWSRVPRCGRRSDPIAISAGRSSTRAPACIWACMVRALPRRRPGEAR